MKNSKSYAWLELIEGILLIICACLTFSRPDAAVIGLIGLYGVIAVLIGIGELVFYIRMERHMGLAPSVSLVSGILCVLFGCCFLAHPEIGITMFLILFPIWIIFQCISRLSHLTVVRLLLGRGYYIFTMVINIIGLILGFMLIAYPGLSVVTAGAIIGTDLLLIGCDHIIFSICEFRSK